MRQKLAALKSKAHDTAEAFEAVAYRLKNHPELLRLAGDGIDPRFAKPQPQYGSYAATQDHMPNNELIDINAVLMIRDDTKASLLEQARLEKSLSDMGYKQG